MAAALVLCAFGCADDTSGLGDGGPPVLTYCTGTYYDLDEQGEVTRTEVPCARGAVCGAGVDYQVCLPDRDETRGENGLVHAEGIRNFMMANPNYPFCQVASDCLHDFEGSCLLQPGCGEPEGICCGFLCIAGEGARAKDRCMQTPGCNLSYCGCDGVTYEGLPTRPYQYPGPCE